MAKSFIPSPELRDKVYSIIEPHRGRGNAITLADITDRAGLFPSSNNKRKIQRVIEALIIIDDRAIAASCSDNKRLNIRKGHYIPETITEVLNYAKQLDSRLIADGNRKAHFLKGSERLFGNGIQTGLFGDAS